MSGLSSSGSGASPSGLHRGMVLACAVFFLADVLLLALALTLPSAFTPEKLGLSLQELNWGFHAAGFLLTLGLLAVLVWGFFPRLRRADAQRQASLEGLERMLGSVDKGLFVLDAACCVDARMSASLPGLLGRPMVSGEDFRQVLAGWLDDDAQDTAILFIRLLLGGRTREKLMRDLNPLNAVPVKGPSGVRYLGFDFRRMREGEALHLMVVVSDVTESVRMQQALEAARHRADEQWALMLRLVQVQPASLTAFIDETAVGLIDINDRLKSASGRIGEYRALGNNMFRVAHQLKSGAVALGLDFVAAEASAFEDLLDRLRGEDRYGGEDLAAVSSAIQKLFEHLDWLRRVAKRYVDQPQAAAPAPRPQADFQATMRDLASRVAEDTCKLVQTRLKLDALDALPQNAAGVLRVITAQLVRNAIAHGIEGPSERQQAGKSDAGQVLVELNQSSPEQYVLRVVDDGRGLCPQRLRQALLDAGRRSEAEIEVMSDQQVVMEIFVRGFTTAEEVSLHAGRGVGLDLVSEAVRRINGKVRLRSEPGRYTEFRVEFAA